MEKLQGPINPCYFGEHMTLDFLEQGGDALDFTCGPFSNSESLRFEEEQQPFSIPSLNDKMPFLQMLQGVESPPYTPFSEPNFQFLLRLQQQKLWGRHNPTEMDSRIQALELESCVTHDISEAHSPIKSETKEPHPHTSSCPEVVSSVCNREPNSPENCGDGNSGSSTAWVQNQAQAKLPHFTKPDPTTRERRKRKRTRPTKNKEEVETQRMTHIAVERNRRRQMNDHLNALRSLMPTSFVQRGDQASIIGGAIDFVKELEQLLQSLQAQKRMRKSQEEGDNDPDPVTPFNNFFTSPQYTTYSSLSSTATDSEVKYIVDDMEGGRDNEEYTEESKSVVADIEVIVIQTHVNLKILSPRRPGQLLKAIAALEELRLTILHLNITSSERSVLYSFNLKIEDDCKLGSADEIATVVHQTLCFINGQL